MSEEPIEIPKPIRPQALTVVCWLSFFGSGLGAVSNLFFYLFHNQVIEVIESGVYKDLGFDMTMISSVSKYYFLFTGLLQVAAFTGVRQMFELKRIGFHFYTVSQLLMLIISTVYIYRPSGIFPAFDLMFSGLFILLYLRFREAMK
jgi:hypothetical protein